MGQIRFTTVLTVLIITLCILLGGHHLYESHYVKNNLQNEIGRIIKVEEIRIEKQEDPPAVYLRAPEIENLRKAYLNIENVVAKRLGAGYRIVLVDDRTPELEGLYEKCSFIIQEAIATGRYQNMEQKIAELAKAAGVHYRLFIDSSAIYLELRDDHGYLYEVIPRYPRCEQPENFEQPGGEIL